MDHDRRVHEGNQHPLLVLQVEHFFPPAICALLLLLFPH